MRRTRKNIFFNPNRRRRRYNIEKSARSIPRRMLFKRNPVKEDMDRKTRPKNR